MNGAEERFFLKGERRWVWGFAAGIMLLTSLPYLAGYAAQGEAWRFTGFVFGVEDGNSYIAKMLSGSAGAWSFRTPYTTSPQRGALIFLPYLLIGKLASGPGLHEQLVALYHLFRVAAGLFMVIATYDFLTLFTGEVRLRRLGTALAILGGGMGWVLALVGKRDWLGSLTLEFYSPETFGFLALYGIPHLALARALLLSGLAAYLRAGVSRGPRAILRRDGARIGSIWALTCLAQPLAGLVFGAVIGLHLLALAVWQIQPGRRAGGVDWTAWRARLRLAIWAGAIPAPLLSYNLAAFRLDPFLRSWASQNLLPSPHPAHYLVAYGPVLPFAIAGGIALVRRRPWTGWLPVAWALALPLLAYAPLGVQRRLVEGVWVALVALTISGMELRKERANEETVSRVDDRGWVARPDRFLSWRMFQMASLLVIPSSLILLTGGLLVASRPGLPGFRLAAEAAAFEWFQAEAEPGAAVLAAFETGNALPAWAPVRVVIGHGPESVGLASLRPQVERFYDGQTTDSGRLALLREGDVRYVFWGPAERALGGWDPQQAAYLQPVFQNGGYAIYAFDPEKRSEGISP